MSTKSNISHILLSNNSFSHPNIAEIKLQSGKIQKPTWKSLRRYWSYASANYLEYLATSFSGKYAVFCLNGASGQCGSIAIWNTSPKRWEQVTEGSYVICAMLLEDISAVISFHYISCWGVPGNHKLFATPLGRTLDGFLDISSPIEADYSMKGIELNSFKIHKKAYGNFNADNKYGPLGIFLLNDKETLIAHDDGNFYQFSIKSVEHALESNPS